ncbi:hypothetical protein HMPREF9440_01733 [Sutterella parvirubra YIT 11816]|uniref:Uncharacterized protein n=1 Tax=Sutterella parvirubra YIT 11816 TaxID=762967 RepID=H3KG56_9BURK|nr:hypothetical protein HMPREF9440_01733 [Sutterella parvirubra YIT 11816]
MFRHLFFFRWLRGSTPEENAPIAGRSLPAGKVFHCRTKRPARWANPGQF